MPQKTTKRAGRKQRVLDHVQARGWTRIGESEWNELRQSLPDVPVTVIQQSGLLIDAPWCGVHQHTFDELENSLREFSTVYEARSDLRSLCRQQVITAKDRAKWLSVRNSVDEGTRRRKATMAEWMLIWLGDPAVFPAWVDALHSLHSFNAPPQDC